ncbi:hypothetical protein N431DRAFT_322696 [Stipitochalara longipes BDJ]|nr:hypothetical protein N431DRAFT_322696 [Stipitochalara longipes BDJ]
MIQRGASRIKKRQQYVRNACDQCKRRKVKCSGEPRCQQCITHRVRCTYGHVTPSPGSSSQASSIYEGLEEGILQLKSKLDQVLEHMRGSSQDPQIHDMVPDTLLLQTIQKISNCRAALYDKRTSRLPPDDENDCQLLEWDSPTTSRSFTPGEPLISNHITSAFTPPFPLSKNEALELIDNFRFEAECFYPFIPIDSLISLAESVIDCHDSSPDLITNIQSEDWGDTLDGRNVDMLRLFLACALASRSTKETETSRRLMSMVSEKLTSRLDRPKIDAKDTAIAALLGIYHLQCDETILAWRKNTMAAKMCQELGLHKSITGKLEWVARMFWCIYILDKRFSFMVNLPFTLQDAEIEHIIPEHNDSLQYISSLVKYVRIAARFVPTMPKLGSSYIELEPSTRTSIDIEADQWAFSTSIESTFPNRSNYYTKVDEAQFHKSFVIVCRNQLKIGLYKHTLFSLSNIAQNAPLSHKAVCNASETIQSCYQLQKSTVMYDLQAVHFNFFVLSAVATLYLAVRHAPLEFSDTPRDIFMGLEILRSYCTSGKLHERVQALEKAMRRLGYDGMGVGPQLVLNEGDENLYIQGGGCAEDANEELMAYIPRLGSYNSSSLIPDAQEAEPWDDGAWIGSSTPASYMYHAWETNNEIV